jgi:hypothetical protein
MVEAHEELIVPMVARQETLEDHIESLLDDEEDDFILDKKVLIKLKKTGPLLPNFWKISSYILLLH